MSSPAYSSVHGLITSKLTQSAGAWDNRAKSLSAGTSKRPPDAEKMDGEPRAKSLKAQTKTPDDYEPNHNSGSYSHSYDYGSYSPSHSHSQQDDTFIYACMMGLYYYNMLPVNM